ncbi:MAG TPA: M48 family metallopeptidase, partial [Polyangiales bacterium]|nr:M48 family metallopeptidase [Polyangiales bacterium]
WWTVAALLSLLAIGGLYGLRSAGQAAVDALPPSVDARLGEQAYAQLALQNQVVEQPELDAALRGMLERLAPAGGNFSYQVHVFDAATANAFALPGGTLVVYTGLLRTAQTPEQVAGVLAHEISHVERRHGMRRIAQSLGVVAAFQLMLGDVSGLAGVAVSVLQQGAINSYSREQEREADLDAAQRMRNAHLDPSALADFLALLSREAPSLPGSLSWLGTHPDLAQRIADIRESSARAATSAKPLAIDWAKLQRELPPLRTPGTPLAATEGAR